MPWELETLSRLRNETEQRLKERRCSEKWTSDGPWQVVLEMTSSDPAVHMRMTQEADADERFLQPCDESGTSLLPEDEDAVEEVVVLSHKKHRISRRTLTAENEKKRDASNDGDESGESGEEEQEEDLSWTTPLSLFRWDYLDIMLGEYHKEAMRQEEGDKSKLLTAKSLRNVIVRTSEECFSIVSIGESYISAAIEENYDEDDRYDFRDCVRICHASIHNYQDNHNAAGFNLKQKLDIQICFDQFAGASGLKLVNVFSVLQALGVPCVTVTEQKSILAVCKEHDSDKSGLVTFNNFLRLYRRILRDQDYKYRVSEITIIKNSGFSNAEIQGFRGIFDTAANLSATQSWTGIKIKDMIDLLTAVGVKFSRQEKVTVYKWIKLVDHDNNGELNFGEFCALMGLIWHTNLGKCAQLTKQSSFRRRMTRTGSNCTSPTTSPKRDLEKLKSGVTFEESEVPTTWVTLVMEQDRDADERVARQEAIPGRRSRLRRMATDLQKIAAGVVDDAPKPEEAKSVKQRAMTVS
eukprot:GEMP01036025.1.p1 GENE.GEMP01036025.1~~GEMP01036025.1.p1  ORF type:complete len:523 (+),score=105.24 GEMP01036025.1:73-1641(+)